MQEGWFAVFNRIITRAHIIKYDCFCHIYWTADVFATTFHWMVHHHKLECFVWKLDCCHQGQDHSAVSKHYWILCLQGQVHSAVSKHYWILCILYFLYHWSLGNQLITKPSTRSDTDRSTLTYSITCHRTGEILPHRVTKLSSFFFFSRTYFRGYIHN